MKTNQQKLITLLEPYRDKTLSFGCKLLMQYEDGEQYEGVYVTKENAYRHLSFLSLPHNRVYNFEDYAKDRIVKILGHPLDARHVLRALGNIDNVHDARLDCDGDLTVTSGTIGYEDVNNITLPLTTTVDTWDEELCGKLVALIEGV